MNSQLFTEKKIQLLARDNPIVHNFLTAIHMGHLSYQEGLIGMVVFLAEHNEALLDLLREKTESEVPLMIAHAKPVTDEIMKKIQELIKDDKVIFEPAYTLDSKGRMKMRHLSINPKSNDEN